MLMLIFINTIIQILEQSNANLHIGFVQFSDTSSVKFTLDTYQSIGLIRESIQRIQFKGGKTDIALGLKVAQLNIFSKSGDREAADNIAIMLTDGTQIRDDSVKTQMDNMRGIRTISVGIGDQVEASMLADISAPDDSVLIPTFGDLQLYATTVVDRICFHQGVSKEGNTSIPIM